MTAKPQGSKGRKVPTTNLADPDEYAPFAKCPECRTAYFEKSKALQVYLNYCIQCGYFLSLADFSLEFIRCVNRYWKGGKL